MDDKELDAYLARQLDEPPLADAGFSDVLERRVRRYRSWRRAVLGAASGIASALALALLSIVDLPLELLSTPAAVVSVMVLTAACVLVWIGTESRSVRRA